MPDSLEEKKELLRLKEDMNRARLEMSSGLAVERQKSRELSHQQRQELALQGNLEAVKLNHELDPVIRDRDFADLVREENVRVQSLGAELSLRWQYDKAQKNLEQKQTMEQMQAELMRMTLESKLEQKKMEKEEALEEKLLTFKAELAQEFGQLSEEQINKAVEKLVKQGKV